MQIYNIPITNDLHELTMHGTKCFPVAGYKTQLSKNVLGYVPLHWHEELQFVLVTQGCACFSVNKAKYYINENSGLFINSSCLHSTTSHDSKDCTYICFDVSTYFFSQDSIVHQKYVEPFIKSGVISAVELNVSTPWQNKILNTLRSLFEIYTDKALGFEIEMYSKLFSIWHLIITNTPEYVNEATASIFVEDQRIKKMLTFIHQNYEDKITLDDIARIGNISRAECCRFFKKMIQSTPFEYLITYRINQSLNLLKTTNLTITEISNAVGFGSVSYYIEKFRKQTNYTPKEFRDYCCACRNHKQIL